MTKKEYMQPTIKLDEFDMAEQLLSYSVKANGLGEDDLGYDENGGNQGSAWSRNRNVWEEEEEEDL